MAYGASTYGASTYGLRTDASVDNSATVNLVGQQITSGQGVLTVSVQSTVLLTGQSINSNQGSLSLQTANIIGLSGQQINSAQGALTVTGDLPTVPTAKGKLVSGTFGDSATVSGGFGRNLIIR